MEGQQPSADYVELVSKDGFSFFVTRKAACVSNTIKQMLSSEGAGGRALVHATLHAHAAGLLMCLRTCRLH